MVDIQTISIAIASASIVVAVIYYIIQIRHQTMMRQTDLVMRLYDRFSEDEFQVAWHKVRTSDFKKHSDIFDYPKDLYIATNKVCLFFEGVGILLRRRITDTRMVEDLFGGAVLRAWESEVSSGGG